MTLRAEAERGLLGNEAPVRQAEAELREARPLLERTVLVAPFDAVVGRKNVEPGDIVKAGESLIALTRSRAALDRGELQGDPARAHAAGKSRRRSRSTPSTNCVFYGHVESFSPASGAKYALIPPEPAVGNFTKVVQRVPVRIVLDEVEDDERAAVARAGGGGAELAVGLSAIVTVDVR